MYFKLKNSKSLILPLILLVVYLAFFAVMKSVLPTSEEWILAFESFYRKYGYEIIFMAAAAESLVLVNLFIPGVITMAMGAIFARSGGIDLAGVILAASMGAILGYMLDFTLGYFGFSEIIKKLGYNALLEKVNKRVKRYGVFGLVLSFAYPSVGSFVSLSAGTIGWRFGNFAIICALATFAWMSVWGILIYALGNIFLTILTKYAFLVLAVITLGLILGIFIEHSDRQISS